ncbi:MAG: response regulator transcription factor [Pseudomonadota bacterium]
MGHLKPNDDAAHILLVDDDSRIRVLLSSYLKENGYRVTEAASAAQAGQTLEGLDFDLIILDVMMPGESGFDFARRLRKGREVPIVLLTALSEANDRINGLEIGADDYITKPFEPRELVLRVSNILKRLQSDPTETSQPGEVTFGPFRFDLERLELHKGDERIRLTDRERQLLKQFAEQPRETVSRYDLTGDGNALGERTADVQINRLRRKIEPNPADPSYLQTVRGIGYRLMTD